jgi:glycosyltransferase involved in cell wall biosynthesis
MRILIATGIYPPDIGGPAKYAEGLEKSLKTLGNQVKVLSYSIEKKLPWGLRQVCYLFRSLYFALRTDVIIALDTVSVGFPAVISSFLLGKKIAVRIGGDFLWETYLERSGIKIPLPDFYRILPTLSPKERIILKVHQFILDYTDFIVFSTEWHRDIWSSFYNINADKVRIVENCYYPPKQYEEPKEKIFLAGSRQIAVKNLDYVLEAFDQAKKTVSGIKLDIGSYPPCEYEQRLRSCYAIVVASLGDISPNSIMEAISYNKPFIITKYNGITNRIGKAGIVVDPNNIESIENGFLKLADEKVYKKEVEKLRKITFSHSYEDIAREFSSFLEVSLLRLGRK